MTLFLIILFLIFNIPLFAINNKIIKLILCYLFRVCRRFNLVPDEAIRGIFVKGVNGIWHVLTHIMLLCHLRNLSKNLLCFFTHCAAAYLFLDYLLCINQGLCSLIYKNFQCSNVSYVSLLIFLVLLNIILFLAKYILGTQVHNRF